MILYLVILLFFLVFFAMFKIIFDTSKLEWIFHHEIVSESINVRKGDKV